MFRYLAVIWDSANPSAGDAARTIVSALTATSRDWICVFRSAGVEVFCVGCEHNQLHMLSGHGLVLGSIFGSLSEIPGSTIATPLFDASRSARIAESRGRELVSNYWGNYIALLHDQPRRRTCVLRGPASSLPCLNTTHHGVEICFSMMEDYIALNLGRLTVDWGFLERSMVSPTPPKSVGLKEVSELQAGECVEFAEGKSVVTQYWDPHEIAQRHSVEDLAQARALLLRSVVGSVHAWASAHSRIMLTMSGGLDSSIVLACLKTAPTEPELTCLNEHSPGPDSDERQYARLVASQGRRSVLVEHLRQPNLDISPMLLAARLPAPLLFIRRVELAVVEQVYMERYGATAIFSGSGGDAVFFQNPLRVRMIDFVHQRGLRSPLLRMAHATAQVELLSIWKVLAEAIYYGFLPHRYDAVPEESKARQLVHSRLLTAGTAGPRPVATNKGARLSPGKRFHALSLSGWAGHYDPMVRDGGPERPAPLLSQPVLEAALQIPTYILMERAWDRGLARMAFESQLPREIAWRREKGGIDEHMRQLLIHNLPFVQTTLIDGIAVQKRLLDGDKVRAALSGEPGHSDPTSTADVYNALCTEVWLRGWERAGAAM